MASFFLGSAVPDVCATSARYSKCPVDSTKKGKKNQFSFRTEVNDGIKPAEGVSPTFPQTQPRRATAVTSE